MKWKGNFSKIRVGTNYEITFLTACWGRESSLKSFFQNRPRMLVHWLGFRVRRSVVSFLREGKFWRKSFHVHGKIGGLVWRKFFTENQNRDDKMKMLKKCLYDFWKILAILKSYRSLGQTNVELALYDETQNNAAMCEQVAYTKHKCVFILR